MMNLMNFFKKKNNTQFGNTLINLPKTAQDTIPFIEAYDNGLFRTGENTYTLIFEFENIDYALLRESEQKEKYNSYDFA